MLDAVKSFFANPLPAQSDIAKINADRRLMALSQVSAGSDLHVVDVYQTAYIVSYDHR